MATPRVLFGALLIACALLGGCASGPIAAHKPALPNQELLQQSGISSAAVGEFKLAANVAPKIDKSVSARGSAITSPSNDSFASYLRDALIAELQSAGRYDAASSNVISGELLESTLHASGSSTGSANLGARFAVTRSGNAVYDKSLRAEHTWPSSFMGAIAIPEAINQYTEMYTRLLAQLYSDPEFRKVWAAP